MAFQNDRIKSIPAPLPVDYDPTFSFKDNASGNPNQPVPGFRLDAEFRAVERALDETQARLRLVQRDDGALKNGSVSLDTMVPGLKDELTGGAISSAAAAKDSAQAAKASELSAEADAQIAKASSEESLFVSKLFTDFLDEFGAPLNFPADMGLISDGIVNQTYDLGGLV